MAKSRVAQEVSGSGNQSAGVAAHQSQINNNQRINLEIHLSTPDKVPLFSFQAMHIHVTLDVAGESS